MRSMTAAPIAGRSSRNCEIVPLLTEDQHVTLVSPPSLLPPFFPPHTVTFFSLLRRPPNLPVEPAARRGFFRTAEAQSGASEPIAGQAVGPS